MNAVLWVAQVVLAVSLIWAAGFKLVQPIDTVSAMWPWAGQVPAALVKFTGIVDLAGAMGLILPMLMRTRPNLRSITALGIAALMICASMFHIAWGETPVIGVNIFLP